MKFGLTNFPTDYSIHPAKLAQAAEERGFESVWFAEHSHIPVSPATPGPPEPGSPGLPREYYSVADPFVALSVAAAVTSTLKLATGICLVPQRDVLQTAKQVASLDLFSGGRFLFGVGAGWNQPEIENHGTIHAERFAVMRERIEAMKVLWSEEKAEYHGKYVDFGPAYAWPKPVQKPHPPIHVGGAGLRAIRRAVRYGDGWVPLMSGGDDDPVALLPKLHEQLRAAGRPLEGFEVTIYFCPPNPETVKRFADGGIDRVLFPLPSVPEAEALGVLDGYAKLI
ncbi:MAG: LLM class F420-dependent oxidoreductase [Deltaproteobacteria bacterium]|nr:LLM class F420-dependent oxidoreductase [Deltaproteobacteria bacterium]TDI99339.1 MAG: LLM class F420-dependent oxidoreductase [Deltaproteobacteria bacterium]